MAFDPTEPRTARIAAMALASVLSLVGIHYTMRSYFLSVTEGEENEKIAGQPAELRKRVETAAAEKLAKGKPLESAISELSSGRSAAIAPVADTQSINLDPMKGWNETKKEFSGFANTAANEAAPLPSDIPVAGGNATAVIPVAPVVVDADAGARLVAVLAALNTDGGVMGVVPDVVIPVTVDAAVPSTVVNVDGGAPTVVSPVPPLGKPGNVEGSK